MINFNYTFNYVERAFVFKYLLLGLSLFAANPFLNAGHKPRYRETGMGGYTRSNTRAARRIEERNARKADRVATHTAHKNNCSTRFWTAIASCFKHCSDNKKKKN